MAARDPEDGGGSDLLPLRAAWSASIRMFGALAVVAIGSAAFSMAFRASLQLVYTTVLRGHDVLDAFVHLPLPARVALPAVGGLLAGTVAKLTRAGGGVGDVMEAVVLGGTRLSVRATLWKALGSWLAIATGNSIGREGPLIQFGGSLGSAVASVAGIPESSARVLIAAGTAAGFAAAYNTPLAAVLFVVEIVTGVIAIEAVVMILIATAISTALLRATVGGGPIYGQRVFAITTARELLAHAVLGAIAAVVGQGFMRMLAAGERAFERARIPQPWRAALGGGLVGLMAIALPEVTGNGYEPLNLMLDEHYSLPLVALLVVAKAVATTSSVSSGSPGGVFTPSLFVGGGVGLLWGHFVAGLVGAPGSEGSYALVGMAAATAATTHAPLMASVLVFELSDDYAIVLPLMLATAIATLLSRRMRKESIYTAELHRKGLEWELTLEGRRVHVRTGDRAEAGETDRDGGS
jgi:CIC family chloride channel protein